MRIKLQAGPFLREISHLRARHLRARARQNQRPPPQGLEKSSLVRPNAVERRPRHRQSRAARDQEHIFARGGNRRQIIGANRIYDHMGHVFLRQLSQPRLHSSHTQGHNLAVNQTHCARDLRGQKAQQICVTHRRERMVFHRTIGQKHLAHEQMAHKDKTAILGISGAIDRLRGAQSLH